MRAGIVSDTHSRHATVERVLALLAEHHVDLVLHCGDIEDIETVRMFGGFPTHFVFGNCDDDRAALALAMKEVGATLHEPFGSLTLGRFEVAWLHGDDQRMFRDVERSGHFDFLFYGHTHVASERTSGRTRVINPGALHRAKVKSFAVLDADSGEIERVMLS